MDHSPEIDARHDDSDSEVDTGTRRSVAVKMGHLCPPWTESIVSRSCPDMPMSARWDGDAVTAPRWVREVVKLLRDGGVDCLAEYTRRFTGSTVAKVYGAYIDTEGFTESSAFHAEQLNRKRDILYEEGKIDHCIAVINYIHPDVVDIVVDPNDDELRSDPDKLWGAINARFAGSTAVTGPKLQQELFNSVWQTKGADGRRLSYTKQVESMISMYQRLLARFKVAPEAYRIPETALVGDFCSKLPSAGNMRLRIDEYRSCVSLAALLSAVRPHAMDADSSPPSDMTAFVATGTHASSSPSAHTIEDLLARISKLEADLGSNRDAGRPTNQSRPKDKYCEHHGWNVSHDSAKCRVLHPPSASASK